MAALFVVNVRAHLPLGWRAAYANWFADVAVPFAFYFLLCREDGRWTRLRPWWMKAALVFAGCAAAELAQRVGIPLLGRTFDPLDVAMYAVGVLLAAALERALLPV
ncbi:MAG: hypothetical protein K2R93_17580 [Gemmatimonadaceae bacterium]|nr:hypothetical protein [Gemmatimonadaceae bacterium]